MGERQAIITYGYPVTGPLSGREGMEGRGGKPRLLGALRGRGGRRREESHFFLRLRGGEKRRMRGKPLHPMVLVGEKGEAPWAEGSHQYLNFLEALRGRGRDKGRLSAFQWVVLSLSDILVACILKVLALAV